LWPAKHKIKSREDAGQKGTKNEEDALELNYILPTLIRKE